MAGFPEQWFAAVFAYPIKQVTSGLHIKNNFRTGVAAEHICRKQHELARTTIGGSRNNPFKWAPTQRLAIDLLLEGRGNFLSGPEALRDSFSDIKRHLISTFSGLHASLRAAIDAFDPAKLDAAIQDQTSLLKSRALLHAKEAAARHADLTQQLEGGGGSSLESAFVAAYNAIDSHKNADR